VFLYGIVAGNLMFGRRKGFRASHDSVPPVRSTIHLNLNVWSPSCQKRNIHGKSLRPTHVTRAWCTTNLPSHRRIRYRHKDFLVYAYYLRGTSLVRH
jgi:hypothetical protein